MKIESTRPRKYAHVSEWISECKRIVARDLDNLVLFTGPEGVGKSTIMYQIMRALDPSFGVSRVGFGVRDFIRLGESTPRYGARAADEMLVNRRKAMHKETVLLLDHLQICRGLNHHMAICFPHEDLLDRAVLDYRVRYNVDVQRRGRFTLRERIKTYAPDGAVVMAWHEVGAWTFAANSGPAWAAYLEAKQAHMEEMSRAAREDDSDGLEDWDTDAWRDDWTALLTTWAQEQTRTAGGIRETA